MNHHVSPSALPFSRRRKSPDLTTGPLTHDAIWAAIEKLARSNKTSSSGLARRAGLDITTFNASKRVNPEGRKRWPSTESIAKVLAATETPLDVFLSLIDPTITSCTRKAEVPLIPCRIRAGRLMALSVAPHEQAMDDKVAVPDASSEEMFGFQVRGDAFLPVYRNGDTLIVSFREPLRRGDRVLLCLKNGRVQAREMRRETASAVTLVGLGGPSKEETVPRERIGWIGRILWAAQ